MSENPDLLPFVQDLVGKEISSHSLLFQDKLLDSMNILNLIGYVEKRLGRRLTDDEIVMNNFQSVETIQTAFFDGK